jgi:hypothetical protein
MDRKTPDNNKNNLLRGFLTLDEKVAMFFYYGGCMGLIAFFTFLIRWLVGIFKGF